jgi:hypothetical protein
MDGQICNKPLAGQFFPGACATGTVLCEAFGTAGEGNACSCADGAVCDSGAGGECPQTGQTCTGGTCDRVDVSETVCPLANLQAGINLTPLPADPLTRTWPIIAFSGAGKLNMGMDGGPAVPGGWYLNNPAPMAGNGTQFVALTGVQ